MNTNYITHTDFDTIMDNFFKKHPAAFDDTAIFWAEYKYVALHMNNFYIGGFSDFK